jgi:hypothetical protein
MTTTICPGCGQEYENRQPNEECGSFVDNYYECSHCHARLNHDDDRSPCCGRKIRLKKIHCKGRLKLKEGWPGF